MFTCDREEFVQAVNWAVSALDAKPSSSEYSSVRINLENSNANISGVSQDKTTLMAIPVTKNKENVSENKVSIPGRALASVVKALAGKTVTVNVDASKVHITSGTGVFALPLMEGSVVGKGSPMPPPIGSVNGAELAKAVKQVASSTDQDKSLPVLSGILFKFSIVDKTVTLVTTDRRNLSVAEINYTPRSVEEENSEQEKLASDNQEEGDSFSFVVSLKDVEHFARAFSGDSSNVTLHHSLAAPGVVGFSSDKKSGTVRTIDGGYPKWENVLTTVTSQTTETVKFDSSDVATTIKRIGNLSDDGYVMVVFEEGMLSVSTTPTSSVSGDDSMELDYEGDRVVQIVTAKTIAEALSHITGSVTYKFNISDQGSLVLMTPTEESQKFKYITRTHPTSKHGA